jgi:hypothetical protein
MNFGDEIANLQTLLNNFLVLHLSRQLQIRCSFPPSHRLFNSRNLCTNTTSLIPLKLPQRNPTIEQLVNLLQTPIYPVNTIEQ